MQPARQQRDDELTVSRPTLRDVAAKTGLSVTQVSRALNDHDDVAESTKEIVRAAAAELQYLPNIAARRLRDPGTRSDTIAVILPSDTLRFSDPFFGDLLSAMAAEAGAHGNRLTLSTTAIDSQATAPYDMAIRRKQVDGFVILRTQAKDERIDFLLREGFPFVSFGRPSGRKGFPAVEASSECFDPLVQHLVQLGHHTIACIAEPTRYAIGAARLGAFTKAAAQHGVAIAADDIIAGGFHEDAGYEAARHLLGRDHPPTAIVALNDLLAFGALRAADQLGLSVPNDLSVVGYDDIPAARQIVPGLTTVRQSASDVGAMLVQELLTAIEAGAVSHRQRLVNPSLVIRSTSGPNRHESENIDP